MFRRCLPSKSGFLKIALVLLVLLVLEVPAVVVVVLPKAVEEDVEEGWFAAGLDELGVGPMYALRRLPLLLLAWLRLLWA